MTLNNNDKPLCGERKVYREWLIQTTHCGVHSVRIRFTVLYSFDNNSQTFVRNIYINRYDFIFTTKRRPEEFIFYSIFEMHTHPAEQNGVVVEVREYGKGGRVILFFLLDQKRRHTNPPAHSSSKWFFFPLHLHPTAIWDTSFFTDGKYIQIYIHVYYVFAHIHTHAHIIHTRLTTGHYSFSFPLPPFSFIHNSNISI